MHVPVGEARAGAKGRNLEVGTGAEPIRECCLLACSVRLSYTVQTHQPRVWNWLDPTTPVSNQEDAPQTHCPTGQSDRGNSSSKICEVGYQDQPSRFALWFPSSVVFFLSGCLLFCYHHSLIFLPRAPAVHCVTHQWKFLSFFNTRALGQKKKSTMDRARQRAAAVARHGTAHL